MGVLSQNGEKHVFKIDFQKDDYIFFFFVLQRFIL